jgi:hypothetical protein
MNICLSCGTYAHLSTQGFCGTCFDHQDDIQDLIEAATMALADLRHAMAHGVQDTTQLQLKYGYAMNTLLERTSWSISELARIVGDRVAA